jgi:hydroxyacylglutathione hydrolase
MGILATTPLPGMQAHALPAFADNYLWLLQSGRLALVLDPGDDAPVNAALSDLDAALAAILVTHHHPDHIGRVAALAERWRCPVFGPADPRIPQVTNPCAEGDVVRIAGFPPFTVWAVPGHTLSHIAYLLDGAIFVGDTLFGAGCGRVFEGDARNLHASLERIAALPDDTWVFCSHEYTRANLDFAQAVEPGNRAIIERRSGLQRERPSVPFRLAGERTSNVFLRCQHESVRNAVERRCGRALAGTDEVFAALRQWKNEHV